MNRLAWPVMLLMTLPFLANGGSEDPAQQINWAINDAPPFHIIDGPYKRKGFCDALMQGLIGEMSEVRHEVLVIPAARIAQLRKDQAPVCFPCMIKRNDTDTTLYTDATLYYRPHVLIANPQSAKIIETRYGNPVRFAELLQDQSLAFGRPLGRRYGEHLQPLIDQYADRHESHRQLSGKAPTLAVQRMVGLGRLDYTLDYQVVGRYSELSQQTQLAYLQIAENRQSHIIGAVGCSRTDWGEQAVQQINQALPDVLTSTDYLTNLQLWFGEGEEHFWPQYRQKVLGSRQSHGHLSMK